jgi:hypothetical protein
VPGVGDSGWSTIGFVTDGYVPEAYEAFEPLRHVFQDSYVLAFSATERSFTFLIDTYLRKTHPRYAPPQPGEVITTEVAKITLSSSLPIWFERNPHSRTVADVQDWHRVEEMNDGWDFGGIDEFRRIGWDGHMAWRLSGQWGELRIIEPTVSYEVFE